MSTLQATLLGVGAVGPGFADWNTLRALLRGDAEYRPAPCVAPVPNALPAAERRRTGKATRLALAAGFAAVADAAADAATLATVFASSGGDGDNCHAICEALAGSDRLISPTRFHNSVNNAASGYWGIASGAMAPSTMIAAFDGSFAAGLLEAAGLLASGLPQVLLIAYEAAYPAPLHATRLLSGDCALACLLAADAAGPRLRLELCDEAPTVLAQPSLEALRRGIPAARGLTLLQAVAQAQAQRVVLDYIDGLQLAVEVQP